MGRLRWFVPVLVAMAAVCGVPPAASAAAEEFERWYVLLMSGERAGWMRLAQHTDDEGRIVTDNEMSMTIGRMDSEISITMESRFIETPDGEPVMMGVRQDMGMTKTETRYVFKDDRVVETSRQLGRRLSSEHPMPLGEWLTPAEVHRYVMRRLEAGATEINFTTLDPFAGLTPMHVRSVVEGKTTVEAMGRTVPAIKWRQTNSFLPEIETISYVDDRGVDIRSTVEFGAITVDVVAADKALALAEFSAPELMATMMVAPDRPIPNPRTLRRAEYVVRAPNGTLPDLDVGGFQRFERLDDASARVVLDLDTLPPASPEDAEDPAYVEATLMADSDSPRIRELAARWAESGGDDPVARASALRDAVHRWIDEKSLGVGFATASEVCETREGDCSEHAVLLAAVLRAEGIPARVVSGLVYVDQFMTEHERFGYHMWTQALLEIDGEPRWIDLDATMPGDLAFDAAHIGISTSNLADNEVANSMVTLAAVLGNFQIEVTSP